VFEHGRLSLSRRSAVQALVVRTGSSVAAAYNALALDGRFKENLSESDGKLSWRGSVPSTLRAETVFA